MVFDSKLKINLYHEHFANTLEKYTCFSKFTLLFSNMYVSMERLYAAFFLSSRFAVLHSMNRFLFRFI